MRAIILQLFCIGLALHGLDGQITTWAAPTVTGMVASTDAGAAPTTETKIATLIVSEDAVAGTVVALVTATPTGGSPAVTYTIADSTGTWGVKANPTDPLDGDVYLHCTNLDYTSTQSYTVVVTATQTGQTDLGTLTLTININAAPYIASGKLCTCSIATGAGATTATLYTFTRADENSADTGTFLLTGGNTDTDWAMSTAGVITTANTLNILFNKCYTLSYSLTDNAAGTAASVAVMTSTVTISVGATGTATSCSCTNSGAAAIVGSIMLLLAACIARFM